MTPAIEAADHDAGLPPLHVGEVAHLARVLLDGRQWVVASPGDMIATYLVGEGASNETG